MCCDIHNPELLSQCKSTLLKIPRQLGPSRLVERSTTGEDKDKQRNLDAGLRQALEAWRRDTTVKEYGRANLRVLGLSLVMGDNVRDRIVDCARHNKIKTITDISRETKWARAVEYGTEVITIIEKHYPPPVIDLTAMSTMQPSLTEHDPLCNQTSSEPLPPLGKRQVTCSLCGGRGHTSGCFT